MRIIHNFFNRCRAKKLFLPIVVSLLVTLITIIHYCTPVEKHYFHDLLRRLYYLPLFLALFCRGLKGGILISCVITIVYLPHFFLQQGGFTSANIAKILELCFLFILSVIFGVLQNRAIRTGKQLDESNVKLLQANKDLRKKTMQLIEVEKSIRLADRIKTVADLTASFAHEIKNPLASLVGAAQICAKKGTGDVAKFANIIGEEATRLDNILMNFLAFVKKKEVRLTSASVSKAAVHTIELAKLIAAKREIVLKNQLEKDLFVEEREGALSQALFNLLKNSIEATDPDTGVVVLLLFMENNHVIIQVRDNGPGLIITEDPFTPFATTKEHGTGLGLTITYKIVGSLGGTIKCKREAGETVFEILLPGRVDRGLR